MNGFLLMARCGMDDVPLGLYPGRADALNHALGLSPADVRRAAEAVLHVDVSDVIGLGVVEFVAGAPQMIDAVADWPSAA